MNAATLTWVSLLGLATALGCGNNDSGDGGGEAGVGGGIASGGTSSGGTSSGGTSSGGTSSGGTSSGGTSSGGSGAANPPECPEAAPQQGDTCEGVRMGTQCSFDGVWCVCYNDWNCQELGECPTTPPRTGDPCAAPAYCPIGSDVCVCDGSEWMCLGSSSPEGCPESAPQSGDDCADLDANQMCTYGFTDVCLCGADGTFSCFGAGAP